MNKSKQRFSEDISPMRSSVCFGEDIYTEILLRLPVKSVVKFQTVSKLWLSIVSSPRFRRTHASRLPRPAAATGLFFPSDEYNSYGRVTINQTKQQEVNWTFLQSKLSKNKDFEFMCVICTSSCNGLQILKSRKWESPHLMLYHIYNPTTQQSKTLNIPLHITKNKFVSANLAFDPCKSLDYKIIFLFQASRGFQLEVYSSTTGVCKAPANNTIASDFYYNDDHGIFFDGASGIFCNGAIHWLSGDATSIVYFNVDTECIKPLQTPPLVHNIHYFGESHGHLHLVNSNRQYFYQSTVLDVYELKRDYSCWFFKYRVDLASIVSALPQQVYLPRKDYGTFMSIFQGEENDDDSSMVLLACNEWVQYNFKKKSMKRLGEYVLLEPRTSRFPWTYGFNTHQFIPTLTCI